MIEFQSPLRRPTLAVFFAACAIALSFALYTQHAWEDYYITFRTSRHLATGHGLVFNLGERLHTFTSPLGVLLPALASLLTFNSSDAAALWIFRAMSIASFGGGAALLFISLRGLGYALVVALAIIFAVVADAKNLDFAINGMESPFLLLFFAYAWLAIFSPLRRRWLHLGLAWGGLMWTRPDGFIYIALFSLGVWLFNHPARTGLSRSQLLTLYLRAGVVATLVYLPWFSFAWIYFGSPVPHPVVAKALQAGPKNLLGLGDALLGFPRSVYLPYSPLAQMFAPTYAMFGGWPLALRLYGFALAEVCAFLWLVTPLRVETKAASFTFFGVSLYLTYFPPQPFPWYLCLPAALGFITLGGALAQSWDAAGRLRLRLTRSLVRSAVALPAIVTLAIGVWFTWQSAPQLKLQQELVENATRRQIGEWLRVHAAPTDAVFLEPLGYIGYFSGLKTYDYPGLSSRAVTDAVRRVGSKWSGLIRELRPEWLVLRVQEIEWLTAEDAALLGPQADYAAVRTFDIRDEVLRSHVEGLNYILVDSAFVVFQRRR